MKASDIYKGMVCVWKNRQCTVIERPVVIGSGSKPYREALKGSFPDDNPKAPVKVKFDDTGEEKRVTAEELEPAE